MKANRKGSNHPPDCPPEAIHAEQSLLGSILLGGADVLDEVSATVSPGDFYKPIHADVFRAAMQLRDKGEPIDSVAIFDHLRRLPDALSADATEDYLDELHESVPHQYTAGYYAKLVQEASRRRQAGYVASDLARNVHDQSADLESAIVSAETSLHSIMERTITGQAMPAAELMTDVVSRIGKSKKPGLSTGFVDVDGMLGGLYAGQLLIVAARPGMGKTALAGNIALNVAEAGTGVLFVSLEQSGCELGERFICSRARMSTDELNSTKLTEAQYDSITTEAARIARLPLLVDDTTPRTISQIASMARLHRRRNKIGLVVVDYLTLISPEDKRTPREQQVAEISRGLKLLARGLEIPIVALAQLNRAVEARDVKRPRLPDLRESGAIEQDADLVLFVHRPEAYNAADRPGEAELIVAKHRNGRTGILSLNWDARSMTFRNAAHQEAGQW